MRVTPLTFARPRLRVCAAIVVAGTMWSAVASATIVRGFKETWPGTSAQGWTGQATESNPGTGGVGGAGDGYLRILRSSAGHLGSKSSPTQQDYIGSYPGAGVTQIRLWVSDLATEEAIEVHVSVGNGSNLWQYNPGVQPSASTWTEYVVDLTATSQWTQLVGSGTFQQALEGADRILIRHDVAPFAQTPNSIAGDFGVDDLEMTFDPVPVRATTWGRIKALYRGPR